MGMMASQITTVLIVYSTVCPGPDQRKHQSSASLAFVRGIQRWPVNSQHKGPVTQKMFPFDDVIMTSIHDDVTKWKHFPRYWPFVRRIQRSPVNSPHKGQWRGALMFSLICVWINGWVISCEAGDLRCHHAHYDITVMLWCNLLAKLWCHLTDMSMILLHPTYTLAKYKFSTIAKLTNKDLVTPFPDFYS